MSARDLVVVGGSAGGVEALGTLVAGLPADLPATVLVNLHLASHAPSVLPQVLARDAALPVAAARHGMPLEPGQVVVGVPDRHLLVVGDRIELGHGPRQSHHRPSHDAMLRSAAIARGPRVVGVVLTGMLHDGAAGLACVSRYGGCCLVQDLDDARFPDMPQHALSAVPHAVPVPLRDLPKELVAVTSRPPGAPPEVDERQRLLDQAEVDAARHASPTPRDLVASAVSDQEHGGS